MELKERMDAEYLQIEVKGCEKIKFRTRKWEEDEESEVEGAGKWVWDKHKRENKFMKYEEKFKLPDVYLNPGSYEWNFVFDLPTGIPSSCYFKDKKDE